MLDPCNCDTFSRPSRSTVKKCFLVMSSNGKSFGHATSFRYFDCLARAKDKSHAIWIS